MIQNNLCDIAFLSGLLVGICIGIKMSLLFWLIKRNLKNTTTSET